MCEGKLLHLRQFKLKHVSQTLVIGIYLVQKTDRLGRVWG